MKTRAHILVNGKVQGVFFRQVTKSKAEELSVKGWVRNLPDGRVEAIFEGEDDKLNLLIDFCKLGPPLAKVSQVDISWEKYTGVFRDFRIKF